MLTRRWTSAIETLGTLTAAAPAVVRTVPGAAAINLVLSRSASLRFRALDAIDDTPIAFVHVLVRTKDGRLPVDRGVATHDGVVRLTDLPPGGGELTVATHDRGTEMSGKTELAAFI